MRRGDHRRDPLPRGFTGQLSHKAWPHIAARAWRSSMRTTASYGQMRQHVDMSTRVANECRQTLCSMVGYARLLQMPGRSSQILQADLPPLPSGAIAILTLVRPRDGASGKSEVVDPEYRNRGVGLGLLHKLIDHVGIVTVIQRQLGPSSGAWC